MTRQAPGNGAWTHERAFQLSTALLFLGGFSTLVVAEGVSLATGLLAAVLVFTAYKLGPLRISLGAQVGLFGGVVAFMALDYLLISNFVSGTVHLLFLAGVVKLFTRQDDKDYSVLYLISLGFLLVASAYTISSVFLVSLVAFVLLAIFTLILFESRKAFGERASASFPLGAYLLLTIGVAAMITLIAVPIFVVIPRTTLGFLGADGGGRERLSGFSEHVNLGEMGSILANPTPVMRVQVDRPAGELPRGLKWRGIALSAFNGRSWFNPRPMPGRLPWSEDDQIFLVPRQRRPQEDLLRQRVVTEAHTRLVFGATPIVMLRRIPGEPPFLYDSDFNVYRRNGSPAQYTVFSDLISRSQRMNAAREAALPANFLDAYLQLPRNLHERIRQKAQDITFGERSDLGKALMLEEYLKTHYGYSLENTPAWAPDPLYDFLFVTRKGHCEYFATAQAVMMRSLGIPSRVVNGFRRGEYNPWSGYFMVRQSDAHSWAEGYFPGGGWVSFDPTPPAPPEAASSYPVHVAEQILEALEIFWSEIVTFNHVKQIGLFQWLLSGLRDSVIWLAELPGAAQQAAQPWWEGLRQRLPGLWALPWLPVLGMGLYALYRYRRYLRAFFKKRILGTRAAEIVPEYYLEMLDILQRKGLARASWETPAEFASRVGDSLQTPLPSRITDLYYRSRYGRRPLSEGDLNEIQAGLKALTRG